MFWLDAYVEQSDVAAFAAVLEPAELERARRFVVARDRDRFVLARGMLRHILAACLDRPAASLQFRTGRHGKPALVGSGPGFNLSHSGTVVMVVVASAGREVGVDIERIRPVSDVASLYRSMACGDEVDAWDALASDQWDAAFFDLWTRKEAVIKATGDGFSREPAGFCAGSGDAVLHLPGGGLVSVSSLDLVAGYAAALAVVGPPLRLRSTAVCTAINR